MQQQPRATLFVTVSNKRWAERQVRSIVSFYSTRFEVEIVDAEKEPERAEAYDLNGFPALICHSPSGVDKVFYSFDDAYQIAYAMGLTRLW